MLIAFPAVKNRSGASGNLATEAVARAAPDGYTLLLVSAGSAINTSLYENLNFDLIRDVAPVAGIPVAVRTNDPDLFAAQPLPQPDVKIFAAESSCRYPIYRDSPLERIGVRGSVAFISAGQVACIRIRHGDLVRQWPQV